MLVIANVVPAPERIRYYKYMQDGRPVFGDKLDAVRVERPMACMIVSQLQSLYPSLEGLQIVEAEERFKRAPKRAVQDRDQDAAQHLAEGTVSLPRVQEQGSGDVADRGDLGA